MKTLTTILFTIIAVYVLAAIFQAKNELITIYHPNDIYYIDVNINRLTSETGIDTIFYSQKDLTRHLEGITSNF